MFNSRQVADFLRKFIPCRDITNVVDGKTELYLRRFFITPRNLSYKVFLHYIARSDEDRCTHDHPWDFTSFIFWNGYHEQILNKEDVLVNKTAAAPCVRINNGEHRHKVELIGPTWTLVLAGPRRRVWGFWPATISGKYKFVDWRT